MLHFMKKSRENHLTLSKNLTIAKNIRTLDIRRGRHASLEKLNDEVYYLSPDGMFRYDTQTQDFLPLPISSEMFKNDLYVTENDNSSFIYETCISIPSSAGINEHEMKEVVSKIKEFYNKHNI